MFCLFILCHKLDKMSLLQAGLRVESLFNPFPWSSVSGLPTTLRSEKLLELFLNFYLSVSFPRFPIMFAACLPLVALPSALHVPFALSPHFFPQPALSSLSSASPPPLPQLSSWISLSLTVLFSLSYQTWNVTLSCFLSPYFFSSNVCSPMLNICPSDDFEEERVVSETVNHLNSYALRGLRTLCMARRVSSPNKHSNHALRGRLNLSFFHSVNVSLREWVHQTNTATLLSEKGLICHSVTLYC